MNIAINAACSKGSSLRLRPWLDVLTKKPHYDTSRSMESPQSTAAPTDSEELSLALTRAVMKHFVDPDGVCVVDLRAVRSAMTATLSAFAAASPEFEKPRNVREFANGVARDVSAGIRRLRAGIAAGDIDPPITLDRSTFN